MARKLPSIFDRFQPDAPVTAEELELAMADDTDSRTLRALDRAAAQTDGGGDGEGDGEDDGEDDDEAGA
jgi:hypothetical protein